MALNILVVDDSAVMRAMIIKTLRLSGIPLGETFQAANGAEGLQVLEAKWVDLVLVDLNMPVMDGETMIKCMQQNLATKDIPVIVVSTESSQSRIDLLEKVTSGFVQKPFTPEILRDIITAATGGTHAG
jgi:two-component system chemotaxis response regulator CheY